MVVAPPLLLGITRKGRGRKGGVRGPAAGKEEVRMRRKG